ncbi:MAG: cation:proton antiporter [Armatimonadetes bacterium]|nr:cation:proton antiporter [Armatimonadota bacterium]
MLILNFENVFNQTAALLLLAAAIGAIAIRLRQPLILGFIAVGILAGPSGFGWVKAADQVHLLAELGLALLLFVVGLRLDVALIRSTGPVALATGVGEVVFTSVIGYFLAVALGLTPLTALYVAVALSFSSTIIVVKLLSDKREADSLHGRIAVGFLIVQDILVILAMIALATFAGAGSGDVTRRILLILAQGAALFAGLGLLMYFVLPRLLNLVARSTELLVLFAIAWAVVLASLSEAVGFSKEVGAFLAGVSLASTQYRDALGSRLVSLRDFLLLFFFIDLGTRLDIGLLGEQVWAAIPLSAFVLVGNPLVLMIIMGVMGYRRRTSFLAGLTVAQISEFSLILVALGLNLGHITSEAVGLVTLVGLVTIGLSTYMILYSHQIYERLAPYLRIFERPVAHPEEIADTARRAAQEADVILFGLGRYGSSVARHLNAQRRTILGVDFNPQAVKRWSQSGRMAVFGDAEDPEFPAALPLASARWVVSSVRDLNINLALIGSLRSHGYGGSIAVTAETGSDAEALRKADADVVFVPFTDAASHAADLLKAADERERRRKMDKIIANLSSHYIICGYGRMGQQIVKDLRRYNVPHVVVEDNPEQLPKLIEQNVPHIDGKASEDKVLVKAGIERAKGLISVAASDEENVFVVLTARGLNPNLFIVARSILEENEDKLRRAGADKVMSPYILGGRRMAAAVLKPRVMDFLDLALHTDDIDTEIGDFVVSESAPFANKSLRDSRIRQTVGVTVVAIRRADGTTVANPDPDMVIHPGDELIVVGLPAQLETTEKLSAGAAQ